MSCLVTRPEIPVPGTRLMSTLCSAAILRTTGDDRVWRSSSAVISARGFSGVGSGAGPGGGAEAGPGGACDHVVAGTVGDTGGAGEGGRAGGADGAGAA
jgi:hypothetical protein